MKSNEERLYDKLNNYSVGDIYPYHMPGHKRRLAGALPKQMIEADITEIDGFDNLHQPGGILRQLQEKAARLYGAEESFYLINGSTSGILAAVSAAVPENGHILMARNCHKSAYHAVYLRNLTASYLYPSLIEEYDINDAITPLQVKEALDRESDIDAVLLVSPTYEGRIADVKKIAQIVHEKGIPLIVDEAHGAHLGWTEGFHKNSCQVGADLVIHSVHKTLPAMTQTALLHVQGNIVNKERLKNYLQMYQTSSPSYVLMASIDSCMEMLEKEGTSFFDTLFVLRKKVDELSLKLQCLQIVPPEIVEPGKVIVSTKNTGLSGQGLYEILLNKYHIQMEMAGFNYVVGILTAMDTEDGVCRLVNALEQIDEELYSTRNVGGSEEEVEDIHTEMDFYRVENAVAQTYHEAMNGKSEYIEFSRAMGRVVGAMVVLYPPGIPVLVPGEIIKEETIQRIERALSKKMNVLGLSRGENKICVLCE